MHVWPPKKTRVSTSLGESPALDDALGEAQRALDKRRAEVLSLSSGEAGLEVDAEEALPPTHEREERLGPLLGAEGGEDEVPFFEREPCGGRGRSLR